MLLRCECRQTKVMEIVINQLHLNDGLVVERLERVLVGCSQKQQSFRKREVLRAVAWM